MADDELLKIDLSKVAAGLLATIPTEDDRARLLSGLAASGMSFWKREARRQLRSTANEYVAALSTRFEKNRAFIVLEGSALVHGVESGMDGGDMRGWMLDGPKVKHGKKGRYLVIPFRHGTPGTSGRNVGAAMPQSIHQAAKTLAPTLSRPSSAHPRTAGGKTVVYGQRLHPGMKNIKQQARSILMTKKKPHHKSSIYTGMIRQEKTYKSTSQSKYTTFRTISEATTTGWHHPGIQARHLARKTQQHIAQQAGALLAASLK